MIKIVIIMRNKYIIDKLCREGIDNIKIDSDEFIKFNNICIKLYDYVKQLNKSGILRFALIISAFRQDNFNSLCSSPLSVRNYG